MRIPLITGVITAVGLVLGGAPAALADTSTSSNWAGYAVHRTGVSFSKVSGEWHAPAATCSPGEQRYSAAWVGLGGYSVTSTALEQIGTETDCSASGNVVSSAWYELVPAPAHTLKMTVEPGDALKASVAVTGLRVTVTLADLTQHHHFSKTFSLRTVDVSSAEWILEAPSDCISQTICQTLPLTDFGSARFTSAHVRSGTGVSGSISNRSWGRTEIRLEPGHTRFIAFRGASGSNGGAQPSALSASGSAFSVSYFSVTEPTGPALVGQHNVRDGQLVHPVR